MIPAIASTSPSPPRSVRSDHRRAVAAATLLAFGVVAALHAGGMLEPIGLLAYDALASSTHRTSRAAGATLVIGVTEPDIARFGWPLPDSILDRALRVLQREGAAVVAIDVYRPTVCAGTSLARWATGAESLPVVFAEKIGTTPLETVGAPACAPADRLGFTDVVPDDDQVVRRLLYIAETGDSTRLSLAYRTLVLRAQRDGVHPVASAEGLPMLGRWTLAPFEGSNGEYVRADARGYQTLLARAPAMRNVPSVALSALLDGTVPRDALAGRMIFLGANAPSLPDLQRLGGGSRSADPVPGVFLHALAADQGWHLARRDGVTTPMHTLPDWLEWLYLAAACAIGGCIALVSPSIRRLAAAVGGAAVIMMIAAWVAMQLSWWIPVVTPVLGLLSSAAASVGVLSVLERRDRTALMDLFSRHVSHDVADQIWRRRAEFTVDGRPRPVRLPVTVLFADIRGYTTIAESRDPDALMEWLNTFMGAMADEVMRHGGIVDDYAGDGIKADFGVPFPRGTSTSDGRDASAAVRCACSMGARLTALNERWVADGLLPVAMRIGIASGMAVAGSLGSHRRLKYTVVGDVVNVAARLESLDAATADFTSVPWRILIDRATYDLVASGFDCDLFGCVRLKGKEQSVEVYEVAGPNTGDRVDG